MKLIKEQDITLEDLLQAAEEAKGVTVVTPKPKPADGGGGKPVVLDKWGRKPNDPFYNFDPKTKKFIAGPCKGLTKAQCDAKNKPEGEKKFTADNVARYQSKLISNAVLFIERINQYVNSTNWNEEAIQTVFKKLVFTERTGGSAADQAAYIDMLYKILFSMNDMTNKYPEQYQYWVSRNYASGVSLDMLRSTSASDIKSLTAWFRGKNFDYIDWSMKDINWYFDLIFKQPIDGKKLYNDPQSSKLTLQKSFSIDQIHRKIMKAYDDKIWGEPSGKRKNVVFPNSTKSK